MEWDALCPGWACVSIAPSGWDARCFLCCVLLDRRGQDDVCCNQIVPPPGGGTRGTRVFGVLGIDNPAQSRGRSCRQRFRLSLQESPATNGSLPGRRLLVKCPLTRNANSVFRRKGGESPKGQGGVQSRTTGTEGHPVCTSEARARKIGEEAAKVAWPDP